VARFEITLLGIKSGNGFTSLLQVRPFLGERLVNLDRFVTLVIIAIKLGQVLVGLNGTGLFSPGDL
jgi:uncharacterized membrane protein